MDALDENILRQLRHINGEVGDFIAGVRLNDLSVDEQITFAENLMDVAKAIQERTKRNTGQIVRGTVLASRVIGSWPETRESNRGESK